MQIEPQATAFAKRYARGEAQVVWTTLVSDLETPVSAFLKIAGARPMSFLLESVEGGAVRGRYSIIGLEPDLVWRTVTGRAEINRTAASRQPRDLHACNEAPLAALRALIAESRIELPDMLPPMAAGIFGYLGYDMVRLMEELPPAQSRSDRYSRRGAGAPHDRGRVRRRQRCDHRRHAGPAGKRRLAPMSPSRVRASVLRRSSTRSMRRWRIRRPKSSPGRSRYGRPPTPRPPNTSGW